MCIRDSIRKTPKEIMEKLDSRKPVIVLDHEPSELKELSEAGVDIELCGHTHDGQMFPGNLVTKLFWENSCGYLKKGEMHNIVTSGIGSVSYTHLPIAVGISEKTGFALPICIGAVVCGAMFGDNLSMISDTTIAAVKTQGCEMKDKFRENFFIVLPAAVITVLIFFFITRNGGNYTEASELTWNFWKVLPYLLVLIGALVGINVFVVLIGGTILSLIVGVATGSIALNQMFLAVGGGERCV